MTFLFVCNFIGHWHLLWFLFHCLISYRNYCIEKEFLQKRYFVYKLNVCLGTVRVTCCKMQQVADSAVLVQKGERNARVSFKAITCRWSVRVPKFCNGEPWWWSISPKPAAPLRPWLALHWHIRSRSRRSPSRYEISQIHLLCQGSDHFLLKLTESLLLTSVAYG